MAVSYTHLDVYKRQFMPYWKCIIFPALMYKDSLLVVAHGNSLRGIIKHLKGISDTDISNLNLPTAVPYVFEFDDRLVLVKDYYPVSYTHLYFLA